LDIYISSAKGRWLVSAIKVVNRYSAAAFAILLNSLATSGWP
jgi:hypothetical protein